MYGLTLTEGIFIPALRSWINGYICLINFRKKSSLPESTHLLKFGKKILPPRLFEPTRLCIFGEIPNCNFIKGKELNNKLSEVMGFLTCWYKSSLIFKEKRMVFKEIADITPGPQKVPKLYFQIFYIKKLQNILFLSFKNISIGKQFLCKNFFPIQLILYPQVRNSMTQLTLVHIGLSKYIIVIGL